MKALLALAAIAVGWAVVRGVRLARALEREELRARISMAVQMENEADDSVAVMVPMTWQAHVWDTDRMTWSVPPATTDLTCWQCNRPFDPNRLHFCPAYRTN